MSESSFLPKYIHEFGGGEVETVTEVPFFKTSLSRLLT